MPFEGSGPDKSRQDKPHLHSVRYSPDGRFLFAADLGTDNLYRLQAVETADEEQPALSERSLTKFATPSGTGPRHFDFHPNGKYLYVLGELSGEVVVYDYNDGNLTLKQTIPADTIGARGSADIHVSPDGCFLYASNRLQADGIAIFSINQKNGTLSKAGYQLCGKHPRNFVISQNGKFLLVASRDENRIQLFHIDPETGFLTDIQRDILRGKPMCLKFAKWME
jgi:6-phosphogluconolactonase (cycloisomerase 2 family)